MLEVSVGEALRRPLGQIDPNTLVELLALPQAKALPASLKGTADRFRERIAREIADIPDGPPWESFLAELAALPPGQIPDWLREQIAAQGAREDRSIAAGQVARALVERWALVEPLPFELGTRGVRVTRAAPAEAARAPRRDRAASRPKAPRAASKARQPRASAYVDQERIALIQQLILERLDRYASAGLAENILVIGVHKQAQAADASIGPSDVTHALKELESNGAIQKSAGRYKVVRTW